MAHFLFSSLLLVGAASAQILSSLSDLGNSVTSIVDGQTSDLNSLTTTTSPSATADLATSTSASATAGVLTAPLGIATAGFSGSVISADPCHITYAVSCTNAAVCLDTALSYTATIGPSSYMVQFATTTAGASASVSEVCYVSASKAATCIASVTVTSGKTTAVIATTATTVLSYRGIPVQSDFTSPTGTCSSVGYSTITGIGQGYTSYNAAPTAAPVYKAGVPILAAAAVLAAL